MDGLVSIFESYFNTSELLDAQKYLVSFSNKFTNIFGEKAWTPNHHFSFHLIEDIRNFGPLHVFQLFAMERCNGVLEGIHTDGKAPQKTMFREVRQFQKLVDLPISGELKFSTEQKSLWSSVIHRDDLLEIDVPVPEDSLDQWYLCSHLFETSHGHEIADAELLNEDKHIHLFSDSDLENQVKELLCHPECTCCLPLPHQPRMPMKYQIFKRLKFASQTFGSSLYRGGQDKDFLCRWRVSDAETALWAGSREYVIRVEITTSHEYALDDWITTQTHRFAVCQWYEAGTDSSNLHKTVWRNRFLKTAEANDHRVIPIARLSVSFLKGFVSETKFKVMMKPNLLILWEPDRVQDPDSEIESDVD